MVKKEREYPTKLKKEEALYRRIIRTHEKRKDILRSIKKMGTGYKGECQLDYYLSFLPEDDFFIFNNVRLPVNGRYFQIDVLLLSWFAAFIIESKNIFGHLFFDSHTNQLFRTFDGQREGFSNPILQAERQKKELRSWFFRFMNRPIPIHYFIAISHPSTIVETHKDNYDIFKTIFHAEHIPSQILKATENHSGTHVTNYQLKRISEYVLKEHSPQQIDILSTYQLQRTDLLDGIVCPNCSAFPMIRIYSKWHCPQCNSDSKDAHEQAIYDHLELFGSITNRECRKLLLLEKDYTTKKLLNSMNLPYYGENKSRVYYLPK